MKSYNIPIFIPHEGCPHDCVFCNQRKITGVVSTVKPEEVIRTVQEYLSFLPEQDRYVDVAFFGGSFTGLPLDLQEMFYQAANDFRDQIDGIRLSTRPDYINPEVLSLAKRYGVTMIELGAQSAEDAVLSANNRGHTFSQTSSAVKQIRKAGIGVGLQMMTGMYGSNPEWDKTSAQKIADLNPDCVRIYPVLVLQGTALETLWRQGKYQPQTLEEAVELAKELLQLFDKKNIPVIRLGLHAGEDLQKEGTVLAGPFHPAFGELVESRIRRDAIEEALQKIKPLPALWQVEVPKPEFSKVIGHKRCNIKYFQENYGVTICVKEKR